MQPPNISPEDRSQRRISIELTPDEFTIMQSSIIMYIDYIKRWKDEREEKTKQKILMHLSSIITKTNESKKVAESELQ